MPGERRFGGRTVLEKAVGIDREQQEEYPGARDHGNPGVYRTMINCGPT